VNRDRDDAFETFAHSQYDQTHILNVTGNYKLTGTWDVGGRAKYNTGSTFTPVDDAVYNANLDKYQPRTAATTRNFSARLPDYNEINVYSNWDFLFDTWKMGLKLGLEYIALGPKAVQQQYNYDYSKSEYFVLPGPIPYIEFGGVL
jgi:hypothetical protein